MDDKYKTQGQTQQPQTGGVGSLVKEHGPVVTGDIRPSGPEPEIHRELKEIDVRSIPEFPTVGPEERKVGIEPAGESVPVEPSGIVHPSIMTEEEAKQKAEHEKPENALKWFAALILKHFQTIHHNLIQNSPPKADQPLAEKFKSQKL